MPIGNIISHRMKCHDGRLIYPPYRMPLQADLCQNDQAN